MKDKDYLEFKKKQKRKENTWKALNKFLESFGEGIFTFMSIMGFLASQLFWIYLLKGFVLFFYNYLDYQTDFTLSQSVSSYQFLTMFWLVYIVWFGIVIMLKFKLPEKK